MTNSIRTLIVDDEPLVREGLFDALTGIPDIEIVGECGDGFEALEAIRRLSPNVVFLDIQMPGLNGFEVINSLFQEERPIVIFVTAFDEFALKAFEINAVDYLLKPFDEARVYSSLDRVRERIIAKETSRTDVKINRLLKYLTDKQQYAERFMISSSGRIHVVLAKDIEWIEAADNYVSLHTMSSGSSLLRETMKSIEKRLDPKRFVRIHRSTIVNLTRIKYFQALPNGDYNLTLQSGKCLALSRSYRDEVFRRMK